MNEPKPRSDPIDALLRREPSTQPPADFVEGVMGELAGVTLAVPLWRRGWVQWLLLAGTLAIAIGRLAGFIFGSWIVIELAG
jgi:hypothetical protein